MTTIHCSWCIYWSLIYLHHILHFIIVPFIFWAICSCGKCLPGFKCRLKMSLPIYPIKPITWMKFLLQLSEWKNYCHFLWLSIYLLLHSINLYTPKTFSARVVSKSNFFSAGKHILTTTCCWLIIAWIFLIGFEKQYPKIKCQKFIFDDKVEWKIYKIFWQIWYKK